MLRVWSEKVKSVLLNGTLVLGSIIFVLIGLEVALRVFNLNWYRPPPSKIICPRPDLYKADERFGYRLWRSTVSYDRYPADAPHVIPIFSNSDGFRSAYEYNKPDTRQRMLIIGNSFVFGAGVHAEERLTEVLESQIPGWRVDNLGMTGWGLDLMLRGFEYIGLKAQPDVVVLAIYTDDFRRLLPYYAGAGFEFPKFKLVKGELVSYPYPSAKGWRRLYIAHVFYRIYWQRIKGRNRYDLNEKLLHRFLEIADQNGSKLVVLFIPGKGDNTEDKERRGFLKEWTSSSNVPFLDLTDPIHSAGIDNKYIKNNWHWNPTGHRVAATELKHFLVNEVGIATTSP